MDLNKLFNDLKDAGQLGEFMELAGNSTGLYNCTTKPSLNEGIYGSIFRRQMVIDQAGCACEGHKHNFHHVTYLIRGKVVMTVCDVDSNDTPIPGTVREEIFQAPASILIHKNKWHKFTALTDDVIAECIYAIRDGSTGEYTENWDGSIGPYA